MSEKQLQEADKSKSFFVKIKNFLRPQRQASHIKESSAVVVEKNTMSRRDFLKLAGKLTLAGILELKTGALTSQFLQPVENFFRGANLIEKGNAAQFMIVLEDLLRQFAKEPNAEHLKLIEAWVKLNAVIHYGVRNDMEMAAKFMHHFLYDESEKLDISQDFIKLIKKQIEVVREEEEYNNIPEFSSDQEILQYYFSHALSSNGFAPIAYRADLQSGPFIQHEDSYYSGKPSSELEGKRTRVFSVVGSDYRDLLYSLGFFTVEATGVIDQVVEQEFRMENPTVRVRDTYDWDTGNGLFVHVSFEQLLQQMGLEKLFADPAFDELKRTKIRVDDSDAAALQKANLAQNYEVTAEYHLTGPLSIVIQRASTPPEEFVQKTGVKVIRSK